MITPSPQHNQAVPDLPGRSGKRAGTSVRNFCRKGAAFRPNTEVLRLGRLTCKMPDSGGLNYVSIIDFGRYAAFWSLFLLLRDRFFGFFASASGYRASSVRRENHSQRDEPQDRGQ